MNWREAVWIFVKRVGPQLSLLWAVTEHPFQSSESGWVVVELILMWFYANTTAAIILDGSLWFERHQPKIECFVELMTL